MDQVGIQMIDLTIEQKMKLVIVAKFGSRVFTSKEFLDALDDMFPGENHTGYLLADFTVNRYTGRWQEGRQFLYAVADGKFRIYDPERDGTWENQKQVFPKWSS